MGPGPAASLGSRGSHPCHLKGPSCSCVSFPVKTFSQSQDPGRLVLWEPGCRGKDGPRPHHNHAPPAAPRGSKGGLPDGRQGAQGDTLSSSCAQGRSPSVSEPQFPHLYTEVRGSTCRVTVFVLGLDPERAWKAWSCLCRGNRCRVLSQVMAF